MADAMAADPRFSGLHSRNACLDGAWNFLEDPESNCISWLYYMMINPFIVLSVLVPFVPELLNSEVFTFIDVGIECAFAFELLLRFAVCPSRRSFLKSVYNLIDIIAILPMVVRLVLLAHLDRGPEWETFENFLYGIVPVLRLLKLLRRFEQFYLITCAFAEAGAALPVLLYCLWVIAMFFSAFIFVTEAKHIGSLSQALWLTLVTMMTVGYGDYTPQTWHGRVVVSALMICSCLYMAIPIGIVGSAFNRVWEGRAELLIMRRTRHRLDQWGYKADDIQYLFRLFDTRQAGELTFNEFSRMFRLMRVGLTDDHMSQLFKAFDADGSGTVDDREFVQQIFPREYHTIFASEEDDDNTGSALAAMGASAAVSPPNNDAANGFHLDEPSSAIDDR